MNINEIIECWNKDANIDDYHLDNESISTPKLHAKYLSLLLEAKKKLVVLSEKYNRLKQLKTKYYYGKLSKEELEECGWEPYQFIKPIKAELDNILAGDPELSSINTKIDLVKIDINTIESIIQQINQRTYHIKNAIEYKKFIAGS